MQKQFLKFRKVFTNFACSPLIFLSNNSELAAKYFPNGVEQSITNLEIYNINNGLGLSQGYDFKRENNSFIAENIENANEESVLISEIIIVVSAIIITFFLIAS